MDRTITVKGTGKVSTKPDLILLTMTLSSKAETYEQTMELATKAVESLQQAVQACDFKADDLKTTDFSVDADYENSHDNTGNYHSQFVGYVCTQRTKIEFDLDTERLASVIHKITNSSSDPQLSIQFTIKDKDALSDELLVNAAENAKRRAKLLTEAAGSTLGNLLKIDYTWDDQHVFSPTHVSLRKESFHAAAEIPQLQPDTIDLNDTATFTWGIE